MKYAEIQYVVESVRFYKDVEAWKHSYYEKSEEWRRARARLIIKTYVSQGSVLQVNVSSQAREDIEESYEKPAASASKQGLQRGELLAAGERASVRLVVGFSNAARSISFAGMRVELFDRAVDEVLATLRYTLWTKFVKVENLKMLPSGVVTLN